MKTGDLVLVKLAKESKPSEKTECIAALRLEPDKAFLDLPCRPLRNDTHHEITLEDLFPAVGRCKFEYRATLFVPDQFWAD
jgi:hypothetical protein